MRRHRVTREEVITELGDDIVRDIGEEGVEYTRAAVEVTMVAFELGCDEDERDEALEKLEDIVEGRSDWEEVRCRSGAVIRMERNPEGEVEIRTHPEIPPEEL